MSTEKPPNDSTRQFKRTIPPQEGQTSKDRREKPGKILPTERISFSKQLDILRAYAAASGAERESVSNNDVAGIVNMSPSTTTLANAFFADIGLLQKGARGYIPSNEVFNYSRAYEWDPDTAIHKLAPFINKTWFAKALMPKLSFRSLTEDEALTSLAEAADAGPDYKNQLRTLLDYTEAVGLIKRNGDQIQRVSPVKDMGDGKEAVPPPTREGKLEMEAEEPKTVRSGLPSEPTEGVVEFHIDIKVNMAELSGWSADRISAFFSGIAKVLASKEGIEKNN